MCGLVGAVLAERDAPLDLGPALAALAHRGPDGQGAVQIGAVRVGHCRLAVIDPTGAAAQPMARDGCGTLALVGEVFDHAVHRRALEARGARFESRADTEVLLHGLARDGIAFLRAVHAMFALAWADPSGRRVWLARDHAGIKPLYVWRGRAGVAFASEVRALARVVRALGGEVRTSGPALSGFLAYGSVPEPRCVLAGVELVQADTALEIDVAAPGEVRVHRVGRRADASRAPVLGESALPGALAAVRDATRRHLVADRPVALFLSAGLDSGVLAVEARRASAEEPRHVHALCVALGTERARDEPALAARLAARLGLPFELVTLEHAADALGAALGAYDQPSVDGLNTYVLARAAASRGFRVALSGLGADEVFGGYRHLRGWPPGAAWLRRVPRVLGALAGPPLSRRRWPAARRLGMVLEGARAREPLQRSVRRIFSDGMIRALMPGLGAAPAADAGSLPDDPRACEQATYLRDTLLHDADVMGMAHGVEIRAPYLDPDVLDAADAIGSAALLDPRRPPKWVLRAGWSGALEPASLARAKSGFDLDVGGWLRGRDGAALLHATRARLARRAAIDARVLGRTFDRWTARLGSGHPAAWTTLFALVQLDVQFERWGEPD